VFELNASAKHVHVKI